MKPDPDTADTLEAALRTMCFHQRAGKLQQTLEKLGVAKASTELRNGNHFAAHQKRFKEERLQSLHGFRRPRRWRKKKLVYKASFKKQRSERSERQQKLLSIVVTTGTIYNLGAVVCEWALRV